MQELIFNTTEKTVKLLESHNSTELFYYKNISTVRIVDGFYESIQVIENSKYPILRVPICNTNMIIEK